MVRSVLIIKADTVMEMIIKMPNTVGNMRDAYWNTLMRPVDEIENTTGNSGFDNINTIEGMSNSAIVLEEGFDYQFHVLTKENLAKFTAQYPHLDGDSLDKGVEIPFYRK